MQRAGIESILGLRRGGTSCTGSVHSPKAWPGFEMSLRHRSARYEIVVENPDGVDRGIASATIDGTAVAERPLRLRFLDDGGTHRLLVRLG